MAAPPFRTLDLSAGSVSDQVDRVVRHAIALGASDVHIEPGRDAVRVRYRLDGVLADVGRLHAVQAQAVASRIKVLAGLDVAERRRAQDGRFETTADGRRVDLRVSVVPTTTGEKVVLRLLDRSALTLSLDGVGLAGLALDRTRAALATPHGLVLVTGPTGSGKTTTLYAALSSIDRDALNVLTVEDPVEYEIDGVSQVHARPDLDFGFADALRVFLRQDPDVIMVGEIRDAETAQMAVRAALTGHLVLSTLHTNDAPSAAARLVDMGVEPYLLAASLRLVTAQRLVRLLCPACRRPADLPLGHGLPAASGPLTVYAPAGCAACAGTGYRGRAAIHQVVVVDEAFASALAAQADIATLRSLAMEHGSESLRDAALRMLLSGQTSYDELLRVTAS